MDAAGIPELDVLAFQPPAGWSDAGAKSWRVATFEELCPTGVSPARLRPRINSRGSALIGCQQDGGDPWARADDSIVLWDGGVNRVSLSSYTQVLMDDDSYWARSDDEYFVYRKQLDGGIVSRLPYQEVRAATGSGWLSLAHWGDRNGEGEIWAPDGSSMPAPLAVGIIEAMNEHGVGVGSGNPRTVVLAWRDGKVFTSRYGAQEAAGHCINDSLLIGGSRRVGTWQATMFWGSEYHAIEIPKGQSSTVFAVNNRGVAVGLAQDLDSLTRTFGWGFAWVGGHAVLLDDVFRDAGVNCIAYTADDINDSNQVVGISSCGDGGYSYYRAKLVIE